MPVNILKNCSSKSEYSIAFQPCEEQIVFSHGFFYVLTLCRRVELGRLSDGYGCFFFSTQHENFKKLGLNYKRRCRLYKQQYRLYNQQRRLYKRQCRL